MGNSSQLKLIGISLFNRLITILRKYGLLIIFLLAYLLLSLLTYKDYGITWDERDVYTYGEQYYLHTIGKPSSFFDRDLGSAQNENLLVLYNHFYPGVIFAINYFISGSREINYTNMHLINLCMASFIFIAAYVVLLKKYKKSTTAILGPLFLLLLPRFIGDIPTNVRDVSFAIFFFIAISLIYKLYPNINRFKLIILGLIFGLTQSSRVVGFTLYFIYLTYALLIFYRDNKKITFKIVRKLVIDLIIIGMIALLVNVITSPYLGSNFLVNFINSIKYSRAISSQGEMLFNGENVIYSDAGLAYLPTLFMITTPIMFMFLSGYSFYRLIRNKLENNLLLIFWIAIVYSFGLYFVSRPIIFDGIRHFLFLLPLISIVSTIGIIEIAKTRNKTVKLATVAFIALNSLLVIIQYVRLYPYQYIYFNELIGYTSGAYQKYENDYWGASYKEAIQWLVDNQINATDTYTINTCAHPMQSIYYLPKNLEWTDQTNNADFFVCYGRTNENLKVDQSKLIHVITRENVPLNYIYKLK